ncbi:hypothetical protein [Pseudomonas sp. H2_H03]
MSLTLNACGQSDIPVAVGNCDRIRDVLGWQPTIPLEDTLRFVVG